MTPLITIENGRDFANEPMTLEVPIEKDDDEFAMAFYYDTETGELEGIPTVELENDHITIVTCHFCDLVVTKEKPERITEADSDAEANFYVCVLPEEETTVPTETSPTASLTNVDTHETIIVYIGEYDGCLVLQAEGEVFVKTG